VTGDVSNTIRLVGIDAATINADDFVFVPVDDGFIG